MTNALQQAREHFTAGTAHFEAGRLEAARARFEAALALVPGRASVLANLGVTLVGLGLHAQAIDPLQAATAADAAQPDAWLALGLSHKALGQWPQAAAALRQALTLGAGTADAWLALGQCEERNGDEAAALRAFERVLALDATHAAAWSARGGLLHQAHRHAEAAQCFERALALGADEALHRFYLASVRGDTTPAQPPRSYVEKLFDQYAGYFEKHLVEVLQYRGHEILLQPLLGAGAHYAQVLDLGCGTGLCARLVQPYADTIDGVDLSQAMVEQARATGLYRSVAHEDLLPFLQASEAPCDLVIAADVFIYVGALEAVFAAVRRRLRTGGCFAFSVERHTGPEELRLLPSMRYAHAPAYVARLARTHGFVLTRQWESFLRHDQAGAIMAQYVHLGVAP